MEQLNIDGPAGIVYWVDRMEQSNTGGPAGIVYWQRTQ
jgi:hypothetical protein